MFADSTAGRRRRMLIAAGWESPDQDESPEIGKDIQLIPRAGLARHANATTRDVPNESQAIVSDPAEEFFPLEPTSSDNLPVHVPQSLGRAAAGTSLVRRSQEPGTAGVPARPRAVEISQLRRHLRPVAASRTIELCVISRLTGESEIIRIDAPLALIGRGSQCDIRLMHADISRRHACVQVLESDVLCYDLGSRTGVLWDGERRSVGWITPQHSATIGPFEIRLAGEEDEIGAAPTGLSTLNHDLALPGSPVIADPAVETMGFEIVTASTPDSAHFVSLRSSVTLLGRGSQCELRLTDDRISRVHSSIMTASDGVWMMDLAGRGGLRVNGTRVTHARLKPGDEISLGDHRLRFLIDQPPSSQADEFSPHAERVHADRFEGRDDGYVSESLVLAMVETFAEMQRQMQEEFRVQMNVMAEMVESLRSESREDVRAELTRLKSLGEEIREAQSRLTDAPPVASEPDPGNASEGVRPKPDVAGTADSTRDADRVSAARPRHTSRGTSRDDQELDGIADHVLVSRRLRALQEERDSSWQKLVRMLMPNR